MKSKSTNLARGVFSWFCFLLVIFSIIFSGVYGAAAFSEYGSSLFEKAEQVAGVCSQVLSGELRDLNVYKEEASSFFERLFYSTQSGETASAQTSSYEEEETGEETELSIERGVRYFISDGTTTAAVATVYVESISKDNLYSVTDYNSDPGGRTVTNDANWDPLTLPEGFNYLFRCSGGTVEIFHKSADGRLESVFCSDEPGAYYTDTLSYTLESLRVLKNPPDIFFAVRAEATSFYASNEIIGNAQSYANHIRFQIILIATAAALFILILILSFLFRPDRKLFETYLAHGLKWIWIEIKILAMIGWIALCVMLLASGWFPMALALCALFFMFYLLGVDISHNRRIYRHNIIHSILNFVLANKDGKRFEQLEYRKYLATIGILLGLVLTAVVITLCVWDTWPFSEWLPAFYVSIGVAALGTLIWFAAALRDDLHDYGKLMDQVEQMYKGDLNAVNTLPATSPLYSSAMQLNMIRDGIKIAVEEGIKSERTKVELITNVSHDIKTPLTSIISYVELLKAEPDLPPHVRDYVEIISQKSDRLRYMIQDIFDVSKAATGNISLDPEYIGLDKLLRQTLADMEGMMQSSPLQWRVQIPDDTFTVYADGQRMYRVFQNLIKNAVQYSLEGSRVYVSLIKRGGHAVAVIQNVSKHELELDGEALTARFVRGDDSRSTSGSGLGLSIAKSFTEACGGTCTVSVHGDLFTVEIALPLASAPEPAAQQPQAEPADEEKDAGKDA
ncbi:MAG: sensor histidine kinase [Hominenteromicrobium sp.]